jgi:hypothetical protein
MTPLLEQAFEKARELPAPEQDTIAAIILEEIADETRWDEAFAHSQDRLAELAKKARADVQAGKAREAGFDEL